MATYYELLDCDCEASLAELKKSYLKKVKVLHPDKVASKSGTENDSEQFLALQAAWETLRDAVKRSEYDAAQHIKSGLDLSEYINSEQVDLDSMKFSNGCYVHPCRCGEMYRVTCEELEDGCDIYECEGCSLTIHVLFDVVAK